MIQTSLDKGDKVEELLVSPTPNASAKAPLSKSKLRLKKLNSDRVVDFNGNPTTLSNSGMAGGRNPFRTPPSLSCRLDKVINPLVYLLVLPEFFLVIGICFILCFQYIKW